MDKCICNNCNNLKSVIEDGKASEYSCEFGFPSDSCNECDEEACSETCSNYMVDKEEVELRKVNCKVCGKQLEKVMDEDIDGEVYCIECYLKMD
jgi:hypothetical protein